MYAFVILFVHNVDKKKRKKEEKSPWELSWRSHFESCVAVNIRSIDDAFYNCTLLIGFEKIIKIRPSPVSLYNVNV